MATLSSTHRRRAAAHKARAGECRLTAGEARFLRYVVMLGGDCGYDLSGARGFRFQRRTRDRLLERGFLEHAELPQGDTGTRAAIVITASGKAALRRRRRYLGLPEGDS